MTSPILQQDLIRDLAKKYKMTIEQMKDLVESPFHVAVDAIRSSDRENLIFPSVRIINFGVFYPSPTKVKVINERSKKKNEAV